MTILAIAGSKGGCGKSTLATALAVAWLDQGRRVVLVDADPQGTSSTWADVANEKGREVPTVVAMGAGLHQPGQLPTLAAAYDVAVVDCPPALAEVQRAALMVADVVLLPCSPSPADVWSLSHSLELVQAAQHIRPELRAAIVINRKDPRTAIGKAVREGLSGQGLPVLSTELHNRVAYAEALLEGSAPTRFQAGGLAALEVRNLADELDAMTTTKEHSRVA